MARLSDVDKDKIGNLIKIVTFPSRDEHPVLLRCSFFMSLSVAFSHVHPEPWVTNMHLKDFFLQDCKEQAVEEKKNGRGGIVGTSVLVVNLLLRNYMYNTFFFL